MIPSGVTLPAVDEVGRVVELARLAERLGFERVFIPDEGLNARDMFVTMTAVALGTETIKIGTGIVNPYTRNPALTAAAVATIDELSGGRAFLGYGAGGSLGLNSLGIKRTRPLVHVREAIEVTRRLLSSRPVTFDGETVTLRDASITYARADIELWFAGRGERMLRQAGAIADGVLLGFLHKPSLADYIGYVAEGMADTGNQPILCYSTMLITDPDRIDQVRPHMTYRLVDSPDPVKRRLGMTSEATTAIATAMAQDLQSAAKLIPDEWVKPFVIMGSVDECAAELTDLTSRHGFDEFMLIVADAADAGHLLEEIAPVLTSGGP